MTEHRNTADRNTMYWTKMGLSVRKAIRMHQQSGQLHKDPESKERPWGNVTEHCLVQTARAEVLGRWIGLPDDLIEDIKLGVALHDVAKEREIKATRHSNTSGESPLAAVKIEQQKTEKMLKEAGFSDRVIRFAGAAGGYKTQLIEAQEKLNQESLTEEDYAYLVVRYVDDISIGSDEIKPSFHTAKDEMFNAVDMKMTQNKAKSVYQVIGQEISKELEGTDFEGMDPHDVMTIIDHETEKRLVERIFERTEERINSLQIPELVDQKIQQNIANT